MENKCDIFHTEMNFQKGTHMHCFFSTSLCILFFLVIPYAQSLSDEQKKEVEYALQNMTPSKIEERLEQSGISKKEAFIRAKNEGVSLNQLILTAVSKYIGAEEAGLQKEKKIKV